MLAQFLSIRVRDQKIRVWRFTDWFNHHHWDDQMTSSHKPSQPSLLGLNHSSSLGRQEHIRNTLTDQLKQVKEPIWLTLPKTWIKLFKLKDFTAFIDFGGSIRKEMDIVDSRRVGQEAFFPSIHQRKFWTTRALCLPGKAGIKLLV